MTKTSVQAHHRQSQGDPEGAVKCHLPTRPLSLHCEEKVGTVEKHRDRDINTDAGPLQVNPERPEVRGHEWLQRQSGQLRLSA